MYERLDNCPICKHTQFDNFMICNDHSVSGESFALVICRKCTLIFTNPRPVKEQLNKYYQSDQYISHTDKGNSLINIVYKLVRLYTLKRKVKLLSRYNETKGTLLDYGCGTGDFLNASRKNKWQAFGYEPDDMARSIAIKKNPNALIDSLDNSPEELNLITAWHVIEHVSKLRETITTLRKKLKKGGHMILALPNYKSFDAQHYKEYWAGYDVPRHLYHFDIRSMEAFAREFKMSIIDVLPMKFDSYYVSMLSEKYKNGGNIIRAFKNGFLSNKKARQSKQYSSLIYILRK
ncbi:MAG: class I SAM-dependent methyltransferase [Ekhidna sp.]|uniref:class I SAM-dependent methyltransferase n=1 Tax=Ekhidna sp. TaxID=2608089 RepID=UPI0032EB58DE